MLQLLDGKILEDFSGGTAYTIGNVSLSTTANVGNTDCGFYPSQTYQTIHWMNYPVYVCHDKTAKAIEILKCLQEEKIIDIKSVPKFIAMVEKISGKL